MPIESLLEQYAFTDAVILSHGFTEYNRDYRITVEFFARAVATKTYEFLFRGCVVANYECQIPPGGYSVNDVFTDYERWQTAGAPVGFVWAQQANVDQEWQLLPDSPLAGIWMDQLGIAMHEIFIVTNVFTLRLVFHDLAIKPEERQYDAR